ncbi:uncharacterized protein N7473_010167 [Penicillium subrubescens]|uniref:uncharacterized protein n=1 Tax=Penicillium subrubescens TaxID=1316194 RepID=UPI0025453E67|nr:uncharacterized protein N7473_010167 [Penicillium subrubescens]KAJ5883281.1 hypothetical protein N7473_010167 [Penicillium subrubescens]
MSHQKGRARVACRFCNLCRVKCDRTIDSACSNCQLAGTLNRESGTRERQIAESGTFLASRLLGVDNLLQPWNSLIRLIGSKDHRIEITESPESDRRDRHTRYRFSKTDLGEWYTWETQPTSNMYCMRWEDLSKLVSSTTSRATIYRDLCSKGWANLLDRQFRRYEKMISDICIPLRRINIPIALERCFHGFSFPLPRARFRRCRFPIHILGQFTFYRRAKALYDTDNELDGVSIVQATILMSEWWGGPMEQKDTWYWLGVAATLAQSLGMHRSLLDIIGSRITSSTSPVGRYGGESGGYYI